jgi:hypothetical protein
MEQINQFLENLRLFWTDLSAFLPRVVAAVVLLILGWVVARFLRRLAIRILRFARIDELAEKSGIDDFLVQGGVRMTSVSIIASILYWIVLLTVLLAAMVSLGIPSAAELFNRLILYVPNVVVAILVLMAGMLLARVARTATSAYLNNVGMEGARVVGAIAYWAILIFVVSLALEQLSIGGQILVSAFQIAFGAFCLALALAFGLGGRDWAARLLEKYWKK